MPAKRKTSKEAASAPRTPAQKRTTKRIALRITDTTLRDAEQNQIRRP